MAQTDATRSEVDVEEMEAEVEAEATMATGGVEVEEAEVEAVAPVAVAGMIDHSRRDRKRWAAMNYCKLIALI